MAGLYRMELVSFINHRVWDFSAKPHKCATHSKRLPCQTWIIFYFPKHEVKNKLLTKNNEYMLLPAEIESKTLIPAIRAILAKKLTANYGIPEDTISKMLGVTQAAISNYVRGTRGDPALIEKLLQNKKVSELIEDLSNNLASDRAYTPSSLAKFIGLCNYIKSSLLICDIHHQMESGIDEQICKECESMLLKGPGTVY